MLFYDWVFTGMNRFRSAADLQPPTPQSTPQPTPQPAPQPTPQPLRSPLRSPSQSYRSLLRSLLCPAASQSYSAARMF